MIFFLQKVIMRFVPTPFIRTTRKWLSTFNATVNLYSRYSYSTVAQNCPCNHWINLTCQPSIFTSQHPFKPPKTQNEYLITSCPRCFPQTSMILPQQQQSRWNPNPNEWRCGETHVEIPECEKASTIDGAESHRVRNLDLREECRRERAKVIFSNECCTFNCIFCSWVWLVHLHYWEAGNCLDELRFGKMWHRETTKSTITAC